MALEIHQFPCLSDNFGVLIHDTDRGVTAAIDAPNADSVRKALAEKGWKLSYILTTHHHADHTDGVFFNQFPLLCLISASYGWD